MENSVIELVPPERVRPIPPERDLDLMEKDLQALCRRAIDAGASRTSVIGPEALVFDPEIVRRVESDAAYPSIHWPLDYPIDSVETALLAFKKGIFLCLEADSDVPDYGGGPIENGNHRAVYRKIYEIVTVVESAAFYMGYHLVLGFATGNCRSVFCADKKSCRPMHRGMTCTAPYKGRPSLEAGGVDARKTAENLQWQIPGPGRSFLAGLVMID